MLSILRHCCLLLLFEEDEVSGVSESWLHCGFLQRGWHWASRFLWVLHKSSCSSFTVSLLSVFRIQFSPPSWLPSKTLANIVVNYEYSVQFSAPLSVSSKLPLLNHRVENILIIAQMCSCTHLLISRTDSSRNKAAPFKGVIRDQ